MTETNGGPNDGGRDAEQPAGRAGRRHRLVEGTDRDEYWQSFFSELPKKESSHSRHYAEPDDDDVVDEEPADEQPANVEPAATPPLTTEPPRPVARPEAPAPVAVDNPAMDQPAVDQPAVDQPVVDGSVADEPVVEQPVADRTHPEPVAAQEPESAPAPDRRADFVPAPDTGYTPVQPYQRGRRVEPTEWARPGTRAMPQAITPAERPQTGSPAYDSGRLEAPVPATAAVIDHDLVDDSVETGRSHHHEAMSDVGHDGAVDTVDDQWSAAPDELDAPVAPLLSGGSRRPVSEERKRKRRLALAAAIAVMVVLIGGVGFVGLKMAGVFESNANYSSITGDADVLVQIPSGVSVRGAGSILADHGVVGSQKAFSNAVGGGTITPGFYKLRTRISADRAYQMLQQQDSEVGVVAVAPGLQLLDTKDSQGNPVPGIFTRIESSTAVTINGQKLGVTVADLENVAANDSASDLGVPSWAASQVDSRKGDARRIEGLIAAPQQDYSVDPTQNAQQILRGLIADSAAKFDAWGINSYSNSGLPNQYSVLVSASIAEKEVSVHDPAQAQTYRAQVTRVILNRLKKPQRLEMDSTINYTRTVRNLSLSNQDSVANTPWNTYMIEGLPPTPIGAVGQAELTAALNPAPGDWLYFVTVDNNGTTLFTADYKTQIANQVTACHNGLIHCPEP